MKYLQKIKDFLNRKKREILNKSIDTIKERRNFRDIIYTFNIEKGEINKSDIFM